MHIQWTRDDDALRRYALDACRTRAVSGHAEHDLVPLGYDAVTRTIRDLKWISGALRRLYEIALCDRPWTDRERAVEAELEATAIWLGQVIGLRVFVQDDPRGPAVRVRLPDGRSNNLGGDDWAVSPS